MEDEEDVFVAQPDPNKNAFGGEKNKAAYVNIFSVFCICYVCFSLVSSSYCCVSVSSFFRLSVSRDRDSWAARNNEAWGLGKENLGESLVYDRPQMSHTHADSGG